MIFTLYVEDLWTAPWNICSIIYIYIYILHIAMQHPESHMTHFSREWIAIIQNQARGNMSHRISYGNHAYLHVARLVLSTRWILCFTVGITTVNRGYKPTYNWGSMWMVGSMGMLEGKNGNFDHLSWMNVIHHAIFCLGCLSTWFN